MWCPALIKLVQDPSVDAIGLNAGAIHALWTLHGLGALANADSEAAMAAYAALKHPSPGVRRNAVQVIAQDAAQVGCGRAVAGLLDDPDPHTRLAAFLALADLTASAKAGASLVEALAKSANTNDKFILDAATAAAAKNSQYFLIALAGQKKANAPTLTIAGHRGRTLRSRRPCRFDPDRDRQAGRRRPGRRRAGGARTRQGLAQQGSAQAG